MLDMPLSQKESLLHLLYPVAALYLCGANWSSLYQSCAVILY